MTHGSNLRDRLERLLVPLLSIVAIIMCFVVMRNEFGTPKSRLPQRLSAQPEFVAAWSEAIPIGMQLGDSSGRVKIVEFTDLECPVCRGFAPILKEILARHPKGVSLTHVSYALTQHRFALPAARAAEC